MFLGLGPCTLNTATGPRTYPVCSTNANLNERRVLSLENPVRSAQIGALDLNTDIGYQKYRGLKLAARHRSTTGVSLNANYTLSRTWGNVEGETVNGGPTTTAVLQYPEYREEAWNYPVSDLSNDQRHRALALQRAHQCLAQRVHGGGVEAAPDLDDDGAVGLPPRGHHRLAHRHTVQRRPRGSQAYHSRLAECHRLGTR